MRFAASRSAKTGNAGSALPPRGGSRPRIARLRWALAHAQRNGPRLLQVPLIMLLLGSLLALVFVGEAHAGEPGGCPNAQLRAQTDSGDLPDCRAYELVSPANSGSVFLAPTGPSSAMATSPSRFAFSGHFGFIPGSGDPQGAFDVYIATRTSQGWVTHYVGIRGNEGIEAQGPPNVDGGPEGVYTDMSMGRLLDWNTGQQNKVCCGLEGSYAPYLWDSDGDFLSRLPSNLAEIPNGASDVSKGGFFGDAKPSPDFSHYLFSSNNVAFAPGALLTAPGSAYDDNLATGKVTIISKTPQGTDIPQDVGEPSEYIKFPAVSTDGSHVLMSTEAPEGETHLYMAVNDTEFFDVSVGQDGENHPARFEGMTADGNTVYFSSTEQLTADDHDTSRDLYKWTYGQVPTVTRISQSPSDSGNGDSCGASWIGGCGAEVVGINSPGESTQPLHPTDNAVAPTSGDVFFYSPELLDGGQGALGERNLYFYRDGQPRYVATFTEENLLNRIQVSADGDHVAFVTSQQLTSYENAGHREMYSYDPNLGSLLCVSCNPNGTPAEYDVEASQLGTFMSDDGRTFFATKEALLSADTDGLWDVYEFVDGRPQLISSGTSTQDQGRFAHVGLDGVSSDGVDVYFSTFDTLIGQDKNGLAFKFYDARTNGGFEATVPPSPPVCLSAGGCIGPTTAAPPPAQIATAWRNRRNARHRKPHRRHKHPKGRHRPSAHGSRPGADRHPLKVWP